MPRSARPRSPHVRTGRRRAASLALLLPVLLVAGTTACGIGRRDPDQGLPAAIPQVAGEMRTQYAMRFVEVAEGSGAPAEPGQLYVVHYTGWLRDGTKFDSSRDRNEPIRFVQGQRRVIAGWDAGFEGMRVGGKRRLFIPYQLAYGIPGRPPAIPPCAELIFDVELLGVEAAPATPAPLNPPRPLPANATLRCPAR